MARLYSASRLITRVYQPLLEPLGLTYPQYIVLMILWESAPCPVSHIGERALLNTNTLPPCSSGSNSRAWCGASAVTRMSASWRFN
mgnify:CR=1 FL=1